MGGVAREKGPLAVALLRRPCLPFGKQRLFADGMATGAAPRARRPLKAVLSAALPRAGPVATRARRRSPGPPAVRPALNAVLWIMDTGAPGAGRASPAWEGGAFSRRRGGKRTRQGFFGGGGAAPFAAASGQRSPGEGAPPAGATLRQGAPCLFRAAPGDAPAGPAVRRAAGNAVWGTKEGAPLREAPVFPRTGRRAIRQSGVRLLPARRGGIWMRFFTDCGKIEKAPPAGGGLSVALE